MVDFVGRSSVPVCWYSAKFVILLWLNPPPRKEREREGVQGVVRKVLGIVVPTMRTVPYFIRKSDFFYKLLYRRDYFPRKKGGRGEVGLPL